MNRSVINGFICCCFVLLFSCNGVSVAESKPKTYEERFKEVEAGIKNNPDWLAAIEKKAKEKNISPDSMMKLDIAWLLDEQDGKHVAQTSNTTDTSTAGKTYEERIKAIIQDIRNNPGWLAAVQQKAAERKISLDSMLKLDASWMIDEQDGKHK